MNNLPYLNLALGILAIWTLPWKIYALWTASKLDQKKWFVALVIINTASIMEIIYIFKVAKKTWPEVKSDFHRGWNSLFRK